jgi:hypothetical protein
MAASRTIRVLTAVVLLAGGTTIARAADIQASKDKLCAFKLEGKITSDDNDRVASLIADRAEFGNGALGGLDRKTRSRGSLRGRKECPLLRLKWLRLSTPNGVPRGIQPT